MKTEQQRVFKFRVIEDETVVGYERLTGNNWEWMYLAINPDKGERWSPGVFPPCQTILKRDAFTGLLDKHGKEIYETDIRREEIEHDEGDETYYCIMTYITEWSMFAWLNYTNGEYDTYLSKGAEALDTVMYWSYPAGQEKQEHVTVCGNLHQDKHLLE